MYTSQPHPQQKKKYNSSHLTSQIITAPCTIPTTTTLPQCMQQRGCNVRQISGLDGTHTTKTIPISTIPSSTIPTSTKTACVSLLPNSLLSFTSQAVLPFKISKQILPRSSRRTYPRSQSLSSGEISFGQKWLIRTVALCCVEAEELQTDLHICRALTPLLDFKSFKNKKISNPYLFKNALMVTTLIRSAGSRMQGVSRFLEMASPVDIKLAELGHPWNGS